MSNEKNNTDPVRALIAELRDGCVYHRKRWSGDTHADLGTYIDEGATDALMAKAADELESALASEPPSAPMGVAYLDIGAGGYMDLGSELSDEELAKLPYGRHVLGIIGTHGVDGYALAQQPTVPSGAVNVAGMPEFDSLMDHIYEYGTTAEGVIERANAFARAVLAQYTPQQPAGEPVCFIHPNDADMLKEQHKALRDIATYWKKPGNDAVPVYLGTPAQPGGSDNGSI